ncbi:cytochrome P450 [Streptomyces albidoflavus]
MLVVSEGNWHSVLKRLIGPFLSRLRAPEPRSVLHEEVREIVERLRSQETTDIALTVGPRLPAAIVCEVIGVPLSEREHLIQLTNHAFGGEESSFDKMTPAEAHTEILFYFHELIERRQKEPGTDLVSALLADGRLSTEDVLINCDNVLIGGNETTRHSITVAFHAFQAFPGALDTLRADPELADRAVEEVVRWTSPAAHVLRVATEDCEIGGQQIREGQAVVAWLAAANPDERLFAHPHRFVVDRAPTAIWGSAPTRSTGQVAGRVHMSSPSASKHLTVRPAGGGADRRAVPGPREPRARAAGRDDGGAGDGSLRSPGGRAGRPRRPGPGTAPTGLAERGWSGEAPGHSEGCRMS